MSNLMRYKGYSAKPEFSAEDKVFYGKILGIDDLIDFYTADAGKLEEEFHAAVDDYLAFCREVGKQPQKEYSGTFNVRIPTELHRSAVQKAQEEDTTLNRIVEKALVCYLEPRKEGAPVMMLSPEMTKMFIQTVQTVKAYGNTDASSDQWNNFMRTNGRVKVC